VLFVALSFLVHAPVGYRDLPSFPTRRSSDLDDAGELGIALVGDQEPAQGDLRRAHVLDVDDHVSEGIVEDTLLEARHRTRLENRSEEHTSELQSRRDLVCRLLLEKKKTIKTR